MSLPSEFMEFIENYKILGIAVAFILGGAITTLVQSLVNNVIMPVIGIIIPSGDWQNATLNIGAAVIKWGAFVSALMNFLIIALLIFAVVKLITKKEGKKK